MTFLAGDTNFTAYSGSGPVDTDGSYIAAMPFVAPTSGVATSLNCWLTPGTATSFVMALYDGVSQLLVYSAPITTTAAGLQVFPIAPTAIKAGMAYVQYLMTAPGSGDFQFGVDSSVLTKAAHVPAANVSFPVPLQQLASGQTTPYGAPAFFIDGDTQARSIFTSGTTGQTVLDTAVLVSRAFNRCKIRSNVISDEMASIARDELFLFLTSDLATRGIQLFAVDIQLLPLTAGLAGVPTPAGTIDVLQANLRALNPLQVGASSYSPSSPTLVTTVAITWSGPAVPILIQSNQSGVMATIASATPNASAGQTTFHDVDGGVAATSWQVIANPVPTPVMPLMASQVAFYASLSQVPMAPYSRDDYANLSNTFFTGRPFQYWLDRQEPWPIMRLWPVPGTNEQNNAVMVIWRHKHIQDVGTLTQRIAVPVRWLTAVIDGLAYRLGKAIAEVNPALLPILKTDADASLNGARSEERERAPMRVVPRIARYTR